MNSGCAVVAGDEAGSPPYLIRNGENGLLYSSGNVEELYDQVKCLLENPDVAARLGAMAYETINAEWNAGIAAQRLLDLAQRMLAGTYRESPYKSGPCSIAEN